MNLRALVSVSGKPGLFKLIGQNKAGYILESLDDQKAKTVVNIATAKMATLEDITVFGETEDLKLIDIFEKLKDTKSTIPDPKTADGTTLRTLFTEVAPGHDIERVYASDMKKILNWFSIIKELPLFTEEAPAPLTDGNSAAEVAATKKPEQIAVEKPKATKAAGKSTTRLSQKSK